MSPITLGKTFFIDERTRDVRYAEHLEHVALHELGERLIRCLSTEHDRPFSVTLSRYEYVRRRIPDEFLGRSCLEQMPPGREVRYELRVAPVQFEQIRLYRAPDPREMRLAQLIPTAGQELKRRIRYKLYPIRLRVADWYRRAVRFVEMVQNQSGWE